MGRVIRAELDRRLSESLAKLNEQYGDLIPIRGAVAAVMAVLNRFDWSHCPQVTSEVLDGLGVEMPYMMMQNDVTWVNGQVYLGEIQKYRRMIIGMLAARGFIPTLIRPIICEPEPGGGLWSDYDLIQSRAPITIGYVAEDGTEESIVVVLQGYIDDDGPRVAQAADGRWVTYGCDLSGRLEGGYRGWYIFFHSERPRQWYEH